MGFQNLLPAIGSFYSNILDSNGQFTTNHILDKKAISGYVLIENYFSFRQSKDFTPDLNLTYQDIFSSVKDDLHLFCEESKELGLSLRWFFKIKHWQKRKTYLKKLELFLFNKERHAIFMIYRTLMKQQSKLFNCYISPLLQKLIDYISSYKAITVFAFVLSCLHRMQELLSVSVCL